ncbi:hypothetical protein B0T22DRAFT_447924 [Podospora appendiculata]|uniref:Uncharacterized protein n=1 Tax=Podospora appendiculata TaxID=314037 RepID=A0AAE0XG62_9PEZI|nr:hypothetical protein B0T22DRAFT_447924 [Podospora appendiculata]
MGGAATRSDKLDSPTPWHHDNLSTLSGSGSRSLTVDRTARRFRFLLFLFLFPVPALSSPSPLLSIHLLQAGKAEVECRCSLLQNTLRQQENASRAPCWRAARPAGQGRAWQGITLHGMARACLETRCTCHVKKGVASCPRRSSSGSYPLPQYTTRYTVQRAPRGATSGGSHAHAQWIGTPRATG